MIEKIGQAEIDHRGFQIRHAVLKRGAPGKHAWIELGVDVAAVGIIGDCLRRTRNGVADLAGHRECPRPADGQVAEAFAEIKRRRVYGEPLGADVLRAAAAPFDVEADRCDELMLGILVDAVFERRFQVLEAAGATHHRPAWRIEMRPGRRDRNGEILGDAFGVFAGDVEFLDRRIVAGLESRYRRHRQFVGDAGVVDGKRRREHAVADDLMAAREAHRRRGGKPAKGRIEKAVGHRSLRIRLDMDQVKPRRAAACHARRGGPRASLGSEVTPARTGVDAGRRTAKRGAGTRVTSSATSGAGGAATMLHRVHCSQAWAGIRPDFGASSPWSSVTLWQMTENGSTAAFALIGARPSNTTCRATAKIASNVTLRRKIPRMKTRPAPLITDQCRLARFIP